MGVGWGAGVVLLFLFSGSSSGSEKSTSSHGAVNLWVYMIAARGLATQSVVRW